MDRNCKSIKPQIIDYNATSRATSTSSSSWHWFAHFLHYKTKVKRFKPTHSFNTTFRHVLSLSLSTFWNDNTWDVKKQERKRKVKGGQQNLHLRSLDINATSWSTTTTLIDITSIYLNRVINHQDLVMITFMCFLPFPPRSSLERTNLPLLP